jgi:hypothetical protein
VWAFSIPELAYFFFFTALKGVVIEGGRRAFSYCAFGWIPWVFPVCAHTTAFLPRAERGRRHLQKVRRKWVEQLRALKELSLVRFRVDPLRELLSTYTVQYSAFLLVEWVGHFKKVRGK